MSTTRNARSRSHHQARQEQPVPVPPVKKPPDKGIRIALRQASYRTKLQSVQIYHYRVNLLSVHTIRRIFGRECPAYRDTLIGPDTQINLFRIEGDELPENVVEAAYIPDVWMRPRGHNAFKAYGSALGFRTMNKNKENIIEWCCFDERIEDSILKKWTFDESTGAVHVQHNVHRDDPTLLFNKVATLPKNPGKEIKQGKKQAYQEHRDWHESLSEAKLPPPKLKLNWPTYVVEYMAHVAQRRRTEEIQDEGQGEEEGKDDGGEDDEGEDNEGEEHTSDDDDEDDNNDDEDEGEEDENQGKLQWALVGSDSPDAMDVT
jgi:hypothetical protein